MIECYGLSDTGCIRSNNEDRFVTAPDIGLAMLADGMGGAQAGERASQLAVETVEAELRSASPADGQALLRAIERANDEVFGAAKGHPALEGMGTTLVAALESGGEILVASVGDSRAYLFSDGSFTAITEDQSWINDVGRPMGLDETALRTHPLRHVLTMAIGASQRLAINFYRRPWDTGAVVLLSSDGLHGVVPKDRIEQILRESRGDLQRACQRLIEAAKEAGAPDNVTAVLVRRAA